MAQQGARESRFLSTSRERRTFRSSGCAGGLLGGCEGDGECVLIDWGGKSGENTRVEVASTDSSFPFCSAMVFDDRWERTSLETSCVYNYASYRDLTALDDLGLSCRRRKVSKPKREMNVTSSVASPLQRTFG